MTTATTRMAPAAGVAIALALLSSSAIAMPGSAATVSDLVEPRAGTWKTWVLASSSQLRPAPPPDRSATDSELKDLHAMAAQRDATALDRVRFWDTGWPGYRWNAILRQELAKHGVLTASATTTRQWSLLSVALYDATIAVWDAKYTYNRPRPNEVDPGLSTAVAYEASPAYPSEHAAVAGAAATVLGYLFPDDADALASQAEEAADSRLLAGVQYPSDTQTGMELGRQVGALVVERGKHDGSAIPWSSALPTDPGLWNLSGYPDGAQPVAPAFGTLTPWVLESGSQFRPGPPPADDSDQKAAELAEIESVPRTFATNAGAFYWQSPRSDWTLVADEKIAQYHLDTDPPRAARADALLNVVGFDATVGCWDAKYTYWARRPFQLNPSLRPVFPAPVHPTYPSAHGCLSGAQAAILAYLFPSDAQSLTDQADEAAESRIWAGIHFRSDIDSGLVLGRAVAAQVVERSKRDGAD